jgi:hypothetical protein
VFPLGVVQPHCRRAVAFIAANLYRDGAARPIVDLASNEVHTFEGELSPRRVAIEDCSDGSFFTGLTTGGALSIHDHGARHFFTLEVDGERFSGFDYSTSSYFTGHIDAGVIRIHDEHSADVFCYSTTTDSG